MKRLIVRILLLWYNHRSAKFYAQAMTNVIHDKYPTEKFKIKYKITWQGQAIFSLDTKSEPVTVCWILIQESVKLQGLDTKVSANTIAA